MFRIIPTRIHGVIDYLMGAVLIALPWLMGFGRGPQTWLPMALGLGALAYSLVTRYELGAVGLLPMPAHLVLDAASGLLLAASPWLFGFASTIWLPHVVLGLMEVGSAAMTDPRPAHGSRPSNLTAA